MNIFAILCFAVFIIYIQAGLISLIPKFKSASNAWFGILAFFMAFYALGTSQLFLSKNIQDAIFWDKMASIGELGYPAVMTSFFVSLTMPTKKIYRIASRIFFVFYVGLLIITLNDVESYKLYENIDGLFIISFKRDSIWYWFFIIYIILGAFSCFYMLFGWLRKSNTNRERKQAQMIIYSFLTFFLINTLVNMALTFKGYVKTPSITPINSVIWMLGILYALYKYKPIPITNQSITDLIINRISEYIFLISPNGKIISANQHVLVSLKYNMYELSKTPLEAIFSDAEKIKKWFSSGTVFSGPMQQVYLNTRYLTNIPAEVFVSPVNDKYGNMLGFILIANDIQNKIQLQEEIQERIRIENNLHQIRERLLQLVQERTFELSEANKKLQIEIQERRRAEMQVKTDLKEKIELVKEIHHRVKNNMQVIISLINMLASRLQPYNQPGTKLREIAERVRTLSNIHEDLYATPNLTKIDFASFLKKLSTDIFNTMKVHPNTIIRLNICNEKLDINSALPCAMIVNELLTNSVHHAFKWDHEPSDKEENQFIISIEFVALKKNFRLSVSDNGCGISPNQAKVQSTLGLQLVKILVEQHLFGSFNISGNQGTQVNVEFPKK